MSDHYAMQNLGGVRPEKATDEQQCILEGAKKQIGFVPNMHANMANVPAVLDTYLYGYNFFRGMSGFTPAGHEVIFLAISRVKRLFILHRRTQHNS